MNPRSPFVAGRNGQLVPNLKICDIVKMFRQTGKAVPANNSTLREQLRLVEVFSRAEDEDDLHLLGFVEVPHARLE